MWTDIVSETEDYQLPLPLDFPCLKEHKTRAAVSMFGVAAVLKRNERESH
jgi:hypothetical protein